MKNIAIVSIIIFFIKFNSNLFSQNIAITDDDAYTANSTAMLDVNSNSKGMLVPRLSTTERMAITNPATGLLVFDTTLQCFFYYNGTAWVNLLSASDYAGGTDASLFAVVNQSGDTVFAVYPGGVRINVDNSLGKISGSKGGFAVGGFSSKLTDSQDYLRVTNDSVRIYVDDNPSKISGSKGGFAVGGFSSKKMNTGNYFHITPENTFIGYEAGINVTPDNPSVGDGKYNSFMGYQSGFNNTSGKHNICLGHQAGYQITSGDYNTFIGTGSGYNYTTIGFNSCVGINSGHYTLTGQGNAFFGCNSGYIFENGGGNTLIGTDCGRGGYDGSYNSSAEASTNNSMLGYKSGFLIEGGDNNSFFGAYSGYKNITGSGNVFIGYQAGYNETGDDKLYISNSTTSTPLIYGDFSTSLLKVNGQLNVNDVLHLTPRSQAPSNPTQGDIYLGEDEKLYIYLHGDWRIIVIE